VRVQFTRRSAPIAKNLIHEAFSAYRQEFDAITRQAKIRFRERNWHGMRADATERLELYKKVVDRVEVQIRRLLAARIHDKLVWTGIKAVYSGSIGNRNDWELAETFFNSVTRRIFATIGVDPNIEFVDTDFETPPSPSTSDIFRTYGGSESIEALIQIHLRD
jgi:isocitrate dehydrogenase kinase/phosphatase